MPESPLHKKIANIQGVLQAVPKNGYNAHFKYDYSTEKDVLEAVRPLCSAQGISMIVSCVEYQVEKGSALVKVELTLTDSESGEAIAVRMPGYAEDSKGDKAVYKALTGATKYAIWKAFGLSSGEDPEEEAVGKPVQTTKGPERRTENRPSGPQRFVSPPSSPAQVNSQLSDKQITWLVRDLLRRPGIEVIMVDCFANLDSIAKAKRALGYLLNEDTGTDPASRFERVGTVEEWQACVEEGKKLPKHLSVVQSSDTTG